MQGLLCQRICREMTKNAQAHGITVFHGRRAGMVPWNKLKITFRWEGQPERTMTLADYFRRIKKSDELGRKNSVMVWSERDEMLSRMHSR
ncbi:MAG: hypothetical protein PHV13_03595 [Candidatus ainarchaeum sp.]|nr:hypothetical protein [Candidatus ainarchaeum sp.]